MATEILLQLKNISVHYGGVVALDDVSVFIDEGEIVVLMGPNGAGKSTVLKTIFGLTPIYSGQVLWHENILHPISYKMAQRGVSFVPQGRRVFNSLSVQENLEMGGFFIKDKQYLKERIKEVMALFPVLEQKRKMKAGGLSGGQQQQLAIARGLISDPKVLLLDEPSLGLAPKIVKEVFLKIKEINEKHKTAIVIVEHNIRSLLNITDRSYVLDKGKVVAEGQSGKILESGILEKVFMGKLD